MNNLKAKYSRQKQKVLVKMGKAEKTVDEDFEEARSVFSTDHAMSKALLKSVQQLQGALTGLGLSQLSIAEGFENLVQAEATTQFREAQKSMQEGINGINESLLNTVLTPLEEYLAEYPLLQKRIDERDRMLLDVDSLTRQVNKMLDNPPKDAKKLPDTQSKLYEAKEAYEEANAALSADLASFHAYRVEFMTPLFRTVVENHVNLYQGAAYEASNIADLAKSTMGSSNSTSGGGGGGSSYRLSSSYSSGVGSDNNDEAGAGYSSNAGDSSSNSENGGRGAPPKPPSRSLPSKQDMTNKFADSEAGQRAVAGAITGATGSAALGNAVASNQTARRKIVGAAVDNAGKQ